MREKETVIKLFSVITAVDSIETPPCVIYFVKGYYLENLRGLHIAFGADGVYSVILIAPAIYVVSNCLNCGIRYFSPRHFGSYYLDMDWGVTSRYVIN